MFDLIIRGDKVVTPHGAGAWDVAVKGETIAALAPPGTLGDDAAKRVINATGKIVMPGGIDPHVHCAWHIPSLEEGAEPTYTAPPSVVSRAALYGGTTTMIDFASGEAGDTIQQMLENRDKEWVDRCYCDFAYHIMLRGDVPPPIVEEIGEAVQDGYATVKVFTTDITPSRKGRMVHFGDIWEILKVLAREGGLGVIHSEDNDIVMHMYEKLFREGRSSFHNLAEVHNALSEDISFRRIIRLAENIEGAALYMMHVSAASGVSAIQQSRAKGYPIYGETLHQYMLYTSDDYKRPNGQIYHTYPSLKSQADQDGLWEGTLNGSINTVATDEICCSLSVKVQGEQIHDTTGGNSGVEPRVAVMYTEMVENREYSIEKFVDLTSSNAARIMGMYPRKGALAAGSDADITILDPDEKRTVRKENLHSTDYTPWEGREVAVWPTVTVLRGKIMVENGEFFGDEKDGKYLKRRVPDEIRRGPML